MIYLRRIACLMLFSAMLTACGSGGSGADASAADGQTATTPVTNDLSSDLNVDTAANSNTTVAHAKVSWSAPTQREDGSEFSADEIAHYEIYHIDDASGDMSVIEVAADANQYSVALTSGSHELGVAVVDVNGVESPMSDLQTVEVN